MCSQTKHNRGPDVVTKLPEGNSTQDVSNVRAGVRAWCMTRAHLTLVE